MTTYSNLRDFLTQRLGDDVSPAYYARALYKATECGAWIAYEVQLPTQHHTAVIRKASSGEWAFEPQSDNEHLMWLLAVAFGFEQRDDEGFAPTEHLTELEMADLTSFAEQERDQGEGRSLSATVQSDGSLLLTLTLSGEASRRWICEYGEGWLDSEWIDDCVAIKVGSIVEGSDVELTPTIFEFPFTEEYFEKQIEELEAEVDYYWRRDNSLCFLINLGGDYYRCTMDPEGELSWNDDDIPVEVRAEIEAMHEAGALVDVYYATALKSATGTVQREERCWDEC